MFNFRKHGDDLICCGQITFEPLAEFAELGYRSFIRNRQGEEGLRPYLDGGRHAA